jgi:hypothetical protein
VLAGCKSFVRCALLASDEYNVACKATGVGDTVHGGRWLVWFGRWPACDNGFASRHRSTDLICI